MKQGCGEEMAEEIRGTGHQQKGLITPCTFCELLARRAFPFSQHTELQAEQLLQDQAKCATKFN